MMIISRSCVFKSCCRCRCHFCVWVMCFQVLLSLSFLYIGHLFWRLVCVVVLVLNGLEFSFPARLISCHQLTYQRSLETRCSELGRDRGDFFFLLFFSLFLCRLLAVASCCRCYRLFKFAVIISAQTDFLSPTHSLLDQMECIL